MTIQRSAMLAFGVLALGSQMALADDEPARNDGWNLSIALGVVSAPTYVGDGDNQLRILPNVRVIYGERFFASLLGGVGYNVLLTENWRAGPIIKYDVGRDEDDVSDLLGLGDLGGSVEAGGYIEYKAERFKSKLEIRQGLSGGHEGLFAKAEIKLTGLFQMFGKSAFYAVGPEVVYGDENYNQSYFEITSGQSLRSGLEAYQADAGYVSYGLHASVVLPLNDRFTLISFAGYDLLGDEAADSPLITQRGSDGQAIGGFMVSYKF